LKVMEGDGPFLWKNKRLTLKDGSEFQFEGHGGNRLGRVGGGTTGLDTGLGYKT